MNDQAISTHLPAHIVAIESGSKNRPLMLLLVLVALVGIATGTVALLAHRTVAGTPVTPSAATLGAEPGGAAPATDASASSGAAAPLPGLSAEQSALVRRLPVGLVDGQSCRSMAAEKAVLARVNCPLRSGPAAVTVYATVYRSDAELAVDVKYEALGDEPSGPCGYGREHVQSTWSAGDGTASGPLHCGGLSEALPWHYIAMEYPTAVGGPVQLFFQVSTPFKADPNGIDERSRTLVTWWRTWIAHNGSLRH